MNPYFKAYAKAHGRTGPDQLAHDKKAWPGGCMAGFMLWIRDAWTRWAQATGEAKHGAWSTEQAASFGAWLESV